MTISVAVRGPSTASSPGSPPTSLPACSSSASRRPTIDRGHRDGGPHESESFFERASVSSLTTGGASDQPRQVAASCGAGLVALKGQSPRATPPASSTTSGRKPDVASGRGSRRRPPARGAALSRRSSPPRPRPRHPGSGSSGRGIGRAEWAAAESEARSSAVAGHRVGRAGPDGRYEGEVRLVERRSERPAVRAAGRGAPRPRLWPPRPQAASARAGSSLVAAPGSVDDASPVSGDGAGLRRRRDRELGPPPGRRRARRRARPSDCRDRASRRSVVLIRLRSGWAAGGRRPAAGGHDAPAERVLGAVRADDVGPNMRGALPPPTTHDPRWTGGSTLRTRP